MHLEQGCPESQTVADGDEACAGRLLAEYLRGWGLRDPFVIASHCRQWVQQVSEHAPGDARDDFACAALRAAMADVERWLRHVASLVSPDPAEAQTRCALLAMAVQRAIDRHPEVFLQYDPLPAELLDEVRVAARPVVPSSGVPTPMHGPPLGELSPILRPRFWRRALGRLARPVVRLAGVRQS